MRVIIEQDPSQAGNLNADHAREVISTALGVPVEVTTRSGPRIDSASDDRTANNAVRHQYRVLSAAEKAQMVAIKDKGAEFLALLDEIATPLEPAKTEHGDAIPGVAVGRFDRELHIARERAEEAVMWAVKHITA